jgi:hypothetical protein
MLMLHLIIIIMGVMALQKIVTHEGGAEGDAAIQCSLTQHWIAALRSQ